MRLARLIGMLISLLTAAALLAPAANAEPPFRLPDYVTDSAGVLSDKQIGDVQGAVDSLYRDRHVRLWVVYVDSFAPSGAVTWAQSVRSISDLGSQDAILAVATADRSYAYLVPSGAAGGSTTRVDDIRRDQIEPALRRGDWAGAAIAAAKGLDAQPGTTAAPMSWTVLLSVIAILLLGLAALILWGRHRRRGRRVAELAAARRIDATDPAALASLSIEVLDDLSRSVVVDVDNAIRTSDHELALATEEFGNTQTDPFAKAVNAAKVAIAQAFNVRQQLDDAIPETPAQRRDLLTRVVVAAARANRELDTQTKAFHQLRDLVINAPERLDSLTQQLVDVTARIEPAQQQLAALNNEFAESALVSVARNVDAARERVDFADRSISRSRELVAKPVAGRQTELIDCIRATESALGQASSMLDAIDGAATDIRRATSSLPDAIADIRRGIEAASLQLTQGSATRGEQLAGARDKAVEAVADAQANGSADPLGTFIKLTQADAELDRLLLEVAEERETRERLARSFDQALFTAQSRVRSVSDYIDTRRGSIGPEARTRLNEAVRQIDAAQAKKTTNITEAIAHANGASTLAAQAQQLANNDVQASQRQYANQYGGGQSNMGAVIGGIILGNILSGAMRGGFGGGGNWTSSSYGGSQGPTSGGGILGGGGRF
ncbi:MAG: TPM domain-containing protein [Mycobacterium sp.]